MVRLYKKVVGFLAVMLVVLNFASVLPAVTVVPSVAPVSFVSVAYADDKDGKWEPKVQDKTTPDGKINLGQTGVFKSLEEQFEQIATNGVKKLRPHIITLIFLLGLISFCTNWSLYEGQMRLSMIIGTIMKIGFFFWLAMVWTDVADAIFTSLQNIGLVAANSGVDDNFASKFNGSTIVDRGFVACSALWSSLKLTSPIISLIKLGGIGLILFSHFWIAFEVFITRVEFRIFECLAFVFLPFGVFQATSFLFQKCVSGVFGYGAKLMVMTFLVGVCESQINWQSEAGAASPFALDEKSTYGDCLVVGLSLLLLAFLVSKAGELASGIVSGQPSMSGRGLVNSMKSVAGKVAGGAAMVAGATMIANAMEKGGAEAASSVGDAVGQAAGQSDSKADSSSGEKLPSGPATESGGGGGGGFGLGPSPAPAAKESASGSAGGAGGAGGGSSDGGAGAEAKGGYATQAWNSMKGKAAGIKDAANEYGKKVSGGASDGVRFAGKVGESAANAVKDSTVGKRAAATLHKASETMNKAGEAVNRPALQSLDKAADGLVSAYKADNLKDTVSGLKQAAGGTAAAAVHGATKLGGAVLDGTGRVLDSRGARVAKRTAGILARAALMRNPITQTFKRELDRVSYDKEDWASWKSGELFDESHNVKNRNA